MYRTQPPRGRAACLALLAIVLLSLATAVPVSAAGGVSVSASAHVTGRDALVLTPAGLAAPVALTVELTDSGDAAATWNVPAKMVANGKALSLDLSAPDAGAAPRNGNGAIVVSAAGQKLAGAATIIDRTPRVPTLHSVVRGQRVGLTWDAVSAADPVTYRLERIFAGGAWATVQEGQSASGYTDRALEPGRYRYRVSAAVPAAGGGLNWSAPSAVQVKIAAPVLRPSPTPATPKPAGTAPPAATPTSQPKAVRERPRPVAATGTVRGPVPHDAAAASAPDTRPSMSVADRPAVDGSAPPMGSGPPAVATPEVAGPRPEAAGPRAAPPPLEPFPVTVPPAGSLAVQAAAGSSHDPVTLLTGLGFLLLGAGVVYRLRGREGLRLIQAWAGRR